MKKILIYGSTGTIGSALYAELEKEYEIDTTQNEGEYYAIINAIGTQRPIGLFSETTMSDWEDNIEINLVSVARMIHEVLPDIEDGGRIIHFSGGGATNSRPFFSAYAAAKAGLVKFTEILAEELRERKITVNAIAPGVIKGRMYDERLKLSDSLPASETDTNFTPIEKTIDLVKMLLSPVGDKITGKIISAAWDDATFIERLKTDKDLGTLRRKI